MKQPIPPLNAPHTNQAQEKNITFEDKDTLRKVENCIERKRNLYPFYHYIIRLKLLTYDVRP